MHTITTIEEEDEAEAAETAVEAVEHAVEEPAEETDSKANTCCFGFVTFGKDKHWSEE